MSYLNQQRLTKYKRQLNALNARLLSYAKPGDAAPEIPVWKHQFGSEDEWSDDEEVAQSSFRQAQTVPVGASAPNANSWIDSTVSEYEPSVRESVYDDERILREIDDVVSEMEVNATAQHVVQASTAHSCSHVDSVEDFDYVEDVQTVGPVDEAEPFPATDDVAIAQTKTIPQRQIPRRKASPSQTTKRTSTRRPRQRVPRELRRNRFEEPGSIFYQSKDVWDSAGIDHDQMRRPYRPVYFNVRGDYPVLAPCWRICVSQESVLIRFAIVLCRPSVQRLEGNVPSLVSKARATARLDSTDHKKNRSVGIMPISARRDRHKAGLLHSTSATLRCGRDISVGSVLLPRGHWHCKTV